MMDWLPEQVCCLAARRVEKIIVFLSVSTVCNCSFAFESIIHSFILLIASGKAHDTRSAVPEPRSQFPRPGIRCFFIKDAFVLAPSGPALPAHTIKTRGVIETRSIIISINDEHAGIRLTKDISLRTDWVDHTVDSSTEINKVRFYSPV